MRDESCVHECAGLGDRLMHWSPSTQDLIRDASKHAMLILAGLASLLLLASSCARTVYPPGAAHDGAREVVSGVKFMGATSINNDELLDGLALRPPRGRFPVERTYFDPLSHRLDAKRIVAFYHEHGFLSAKIRKAEVIKKGRRRRKLVYHIEEGPQTTIASIEVEVQGDSELAPLKLAQLLSVRVGAPLHYESYERGKDDLLRILIEEGYAFARVTGSVEVPPDKKAAGLRYRVVPGPIASFGALHIEGNDRIPDSLILSQIDFREGDEFSWKLLEKTRTKLYALGVFASVEFDFNRKERLAVTPLTLRLREAARYELKLGAGVGIDRVNYEVRARGSYRVASFLLPMGQLKLEATPRLTYLRGFDDTVAPAFEAASSYTLKNLLLTNIDFSSKFSYAVDNFTSYSIQGPRVSFGLSRGFLDNRLQLSILWRFRYQYLFRVDDALSEEDRASVGLVEPYRLGTLVQKISYDRRDDQLAPTRGWYLSFEIEEATSSLASQYEYIRASPEARAYYPIGSATVLAARLRLASTLLIGDLLPITQRYFSGGSSSQRGFAQRTLSPVLGTGGGVPVGGEALVETNFEVRQSIGDSDFALVAFLDGAEVTNKSEDLFADGLHWAAGLGLRLHTIVGTLRSDFGYRLNRKEASDPVPGSNWNWFINLGEAF